MTITESRLVHRGRHLLPSMPDCTGLPDRPENGDKNGFPADIDWYCAFSFHKPGSWLWTFANSVFLLISRAKGLSWSKNCCRCLKILIWLVDSRRPKNFPVVDSQVTGIPRCKKETMAWEETWTVSISTNPSNVSSGISIRTSAFRETTNLPSLWEIKVPFSVT